jgi:hypothetical protein
MLALLFTLRPDLSPRVTESASSEQVYLNPLSKCSSLFEEGDGSKDEEHTFITCFLR